MLVTGLLHMQHGGYFQKVPDLVYGLGDMKKVQRDVNYLSVRNIKGNHINLYIEHNEEVDFVEFVNNGNELDGDHCDHIANNEYDEYGYDVDEEEGKKKIQEEIVAYLEGLRAKNRGDWVGSNAFDNIYAHHQDFNDADSPVTSEIDDDGSDDEGRKKKKKMTTAYPRCNANSSKERAKL
ncbi:hypothetical protein Cgig2_021543 [Carnegiea gigantea]|uniref:Uncharacterized protein n=1 Tax=Carnegiea gigantea TaxID=171969 RepID=A0A9Q1GU06_9CARY|nr:hypothetical protein Cgig2_021543 [Carnegiea gigantea]